MTDVEMIQNQIDILKAQVMLVPKERAVQDAQLSHGRAAQDAANASNLKRLQEALAKAQPAS